MRGQTLSEGSRSGNRHDGSSRMRWIGRLPKSSTASNVLLPGTHTSTGYVTIAVRLSFITAFRIGRIACEPGANFTSSTTGDGIWPFCLTVTVVLPDAVVLRWIEPSTLSVVNSQ